MKITKLSITSILFILLFTGCSASIGTKVKMSELLSDKEKLLDSLITIEIPACNSYKDSRKPSKRLLQVQREIPFVLTDAKFKECYTKNFKSYVEFTLPMQLSKGINKSKKYIGIGVDKINLLYVYVPQKIQSGIKNIQKSSIIKTDLKVRIQLFNDLGKPSPQFTALSLFLREEPMEVMQIHLNKNSNPIITLSDVSVSKALNSSFVMVLLKSNSK